MKATQAKVLTDGHPTDFKKSMRDAFGTNTQPTLKELLNIVAYEKERLEW
jgi:hypothetical protein